MNREPVLLWKHFEDICQIPRGSGNEAGMREYIKSYAKQHGFGYAEDAYGNSLVSVPGRGQGAHSPAVIIQAHSDMVCVKEESLEHDFTRDPIVTQEVEWTEKGVTKTMLMATGTTLGADNGIGLVSGLAVAIDPNITDCPPLELLITVEEEVGLTGARRLDPSLLRTDYLINLDMEGLGQLCVSCAGGRDMVIDWAITRETPEGIPLCLSVSGLPGGHSGVEIHGKRGNAIIQLLHAIRKNQELDGVARLAAFSGGSARNVIPSQAEIVLWVPEQFADLLEDTFTSPALRLQILEQIQTDKPELVATHCERLNPIDSPKPISLTQTQQILSAIASIPNGVHEWSPIVQGLVETSNNVAVISMDGEQLRLQCSTRSSKEGAIADFQTALLPMLEKSGATVTFGEGYPGWPADPDNALLSIAKKTFAQVLGAPPEIMAVHAGLECGVLKGKRPTLQMISFGPNLAGAHTIEERIDLESVPPFYACLTKLLNRLAVTA